MKEYMKPPKVFDPNVKMKDSGVPWIGKIPERWELRKIKHISLVKRGASPRPIDDPKYFDDKGDYSWVRISDVTASNKYLEKTEQKLSDLGKSLSVPIEPGCLFLSIAGSVGKAIITKIKCCIHDGFVYFPYYKHDQEYLYYIFTSENLFGGLGKMGTQLNLNTDTVGEIKIPLPPLPVQKAIAAFLDKETARIDALIAKKEHQIELLQEKRQAVITRAVTKGLNPNAKMKYSGVPWIGDVPEHWEVKRTRFMLIMNPSKQEIYHLDPETEVVFLPMEAVGEDGSLQLDTTRPISEVSTGYTFFAEGDVAFAKITPCFENGKGAIMRDLKTGYGFGTTELTVMRPGKGLDEEYLFYISTSREFRQNGASWMYGAGGQKRVPDDFVKEFKFTFPPLTEQQAIAAFLDSETAKIDVLVSKVKTSIEKLKEFRTAVITAAVLGQIEVSIPMKEKN